MKGPMDTARMDPRQGSRAVALRTVGRKTLLLGGAVMVTLVTATIPAQGVDASPGMPDFSAFTRPTAPGNRRYPSPVAVVDESKSSRQIEEGRKRVKAGDYRGALDAFRAAVIADTEDDLAQAYFALGLILIGDGRNSDKALRSAVQAGFSGPLEVKGLWKDERERTRVLEVLGRIVGEGELTAAWTLFLLGEPVFLKRLAAKDAIARKLLHP